MGKETTIKKISRRNPEDLEVYQCGYFYFKNYKRDSSAGFFVMRVPNGFIYYKGDRAEGGVFVPNA